MWGAYAKNREVEKVKPFESRARKMVERLTAIDDAWLKLFGPGPGASSVLLEACELLNEAITRGVKGKEPK